MLSGFILLGHRECNGLCRLSILGGDKVKQHLLGIHMIFLFVPLLNNLFIEAVAICRF